MSDDLRDKLFRFIEERYDAGVEYALPTGGELPEKEKKRHLALYLPALFEQLTTTTHDQLYNLIKRVLEAGGNYNDVKIAIEQAYMFSMTRAMTIALTESIDNFNYGSLQSWKKGGVKAVGVIDGDKFDAPCIIANGSIWSVDFAMQHLSQHPRCQRNFVGAPDTNADAVKQFEHRYLSVGG